MTMGSKLLLLTAAVVVVSCHASSSAHRQLFINGEEDPHSLLKERHDFPPKAKPIKKGEVVTKYSHLMSETMCRPQENGYFGSTAGIPMVLEYGFELESTLFANIDQVLDAINQYVETQILSRAFSSICGMERRLAEALGIDIGDENSMDRQISYFGGMDSSTQSSVSDKVTGFKFSEGALEPLLICEPTKHEQNTCGYYTSEIRVYGRNMGAATSDIVLDTVRAALPLAIEMAAKYGAVRIEVVDHMTKLISGPNEIATHDSVSAGAMVGLFFSVVVLMASLFSLYVFWRADRNKAYVCDEHGHMLKRGGHCRGGASIDSTVRASTASQPSVMSHDEQRRHYNRTLVEFGPSFDMERDRVVQELEEESSCLPDYVLEDPVYTDYLDSQYRDNDGVNMEII
ncbi:hypothetical protein MPSEU_001086200 [Mayamaea pseudoterrestris]|nr:hypothetical protein MPSEU_001086200 [Mayamaea pseudoterrestris]